MLVYVRMFVRNTFAHTHVAYLCSCLRVLPACLCLLACFVCVLSLSLPFACCVWCVCVYVPRVYLACFYRRALVHCLAPQCRPTISISAGLTFASSMMSASCCSAAACSEPTQRAASRAIVRRRFQRIRGLHHVQRPDAHNFAVQRMELLESKALYALHGLNVGSIASKQQYHVPPGLGFVTVSDSALASSALDESAGPTVLHKASGVVVVPPQASAMGVGIFLALAIEARQSRPPMLDVYSFKDVSILGHNANQIQHFWHVLGRHQHFRAAQYWWIVHAPGQRSPLHLF